jgi:PmbA protein
VIERLLDALSRPVGNGARVRAFSIFATESRRLGVGTKDRETGSVHTPLALAESAGGHYLLVWEDGRVSRGGLERRHFTTDVKEALERALAAAYDDPDAAHVLGPSRLPEVEIFSEESERASSGATDLLADRLRRIRARVDRDGFRTWSGSIGATSASSRLVTSAGLDVEGRGTSFGWHVTLDGVLGTGYGARAPEPVDEFEARLARLAETAKRLRGEPRPLVEPGPRLLHPDVVDELILATVLHNLDAATVDHGDGAFRREQFGPGAAPALRDDLTLRLDPLEPLRAGSYRFTREGVPAARIAYVDRGRLTTPIADVKYARRLGIEPTPLPMGMDTLHLEGPERISLAEAYRRAAGGALVLSVLGVHTQDPSSGDFSLSAPQALLLGSAGPADRVRLTIAGNVLGILRDPRTGLVEFEGETTPGILFWPPGA